MDGVQEVAENGTQEDQVVVGELEASQATKVMPNDDNDAPEEQTAE